jgi:hypothetical protein
MVKKVWLIGLCFGAQVWAHPGHGIDSPHSHANELIGLLVLAVVLAGIWWEGRK